MIILNVGKTPINVRGHILQTGEHVSVRLMYDISTKIILNRFKVKVFPEKPEEAKYLIYNKYIKFPIKFEEYRLTSEYKNLVNRMEVQVPEVKEPETPADTSPEVKEEVKESIKESELPEEKKDEPKVEEPKEEVPPPEVKDLPPVEPEKPAEEVKPEPKAEITETDQPVVRKRRGRRRKEVTPPPEVPQTPAALPELPKNEVTTPESELEKAKEESELLESEFKEDLNPSSES